MPRLYHVTSTQEADDARAAGEYVPAAFAQEGFIHCSYAHQVQRVANRFYHGRADLVLLEIDPSRLRSDVIDENLEGGSELFPHIYGHLPMDAVAGVHAFPRNADGSFDIPATVAIDN